MIDTEQIISPGNCADMAQVREGVDAVDRNLVALLAKRFGYMDAAARIKTDRATVRDEARKAEVIGNAVAMAATLGVPETYVADMWERLVEASIAHELKTWDELRRNDD